MITMLSRLSFSMAPWTSHWHSRLVIDLAVTSYVCGIFSCKSRPLECTTPSHHLFSSLDGCDTQRCSTISVNVQKATFWDTYFIILVISYQSFHYLYLSRKFVLKVSLWPVLFNDWKESCSIILITIIEKLIYIGIVIAA